MAEEKVVASFAMTEEQIEKRFAEIESKHASELAALKSAAEEQATKLAAEVETERTARVAAEHDARIKRFTDEVRGRSDSNGAAWVGDVKAKVATLDHLAKTAGEDSDVFKNYVTDQRAVAAQIKDSGLFKSFGSDASGADIEANPFDALMTQARAYSEAHPGVTPEVAFADVVTKDPKNKSLVSQL